MEGTEVEKNQANAMQLKMVGQTEEDFHGLVGLHLHYPPVTASEVPISGSISVVKPQQCAPVVHQFTVDANLFERWHDVGSTQGLHSDAQIANFLLQHYETALNIHPATQCVGCRALLPMYCPKCSLASQHFAQNQMAFSLPTSDNRLNMTNTVTSYPNMGNSDTFEGTPMVNSQTSSSLTSLGNDILMNMSEPVKTEGYNVNKPKRKKKKKIKKLKGKRGNFTCKECGTHIQQSPSPKVKRRAGFKPYKCSECGAAFSCRRALEEHLFRKEDNADKYTCTHCEAVLVNQSQLRSHTFHHAGEMPFRCSHCPLAFSLACNLKTHVRTHTGEKPYQCNQCHMAFTQSIALKVHTRKHTGEKPFRCNQCHMAFAASSNLSRHMLRHTGQKPYKCLYCDAAFAQPGSLKTHTRKHTGERPYKCDLCNSSFSDHSTLWKHKRNNSCVNGVHHNRNKKIVNVSNIPVIPVGTVQHLYGTQPAASVEETTYMGEVGNIGWCFPMQQP